MVPVNDTELFKYLRTGDMNKALSQLNHNMTMAVLPVTVFIGLECVVGLVGNILILLVYTLRYEKSNFRYFVVSMAVVDLTSCLTTLPGEIFSQMNWYTYEHAWICKVKSYFNVLTVWASASILFGLAFDRYRKICRPLAWQMRQTVALRMCVVSVVIAAVVASPITILWGRQDYLYVDGELTMNVSVCEKSGRYANDVYPLVYIACVYILPIGVMLFVVTILNVLTAKTLFCGIGDLRKSLFKEASASASTLQSVISTISIGDAFTNNQTSSSDSTSSRETNIANVNIRCTNIDIWIESDVHGLSTFSDNSTENAFKSDTCDPSVNINDKPMNAKYDTTNCDRHYSSTRRCIENEMEHSSVPITSATNEPRRAQFSLPSEPHVNTMSSKNLRGVSSKGQSYVPELKRKRKTLIMLVLTSVFIITMLMYVIMISFVADSEGTLRNLSNADKVKFFFFWRMYFINCLINPILYGFMDPRFRSGLKWLFKHKYNRTTLRRTHN